MIQLRAKKSYTVWNLSVLADFVWITLFWQLHEIEARPFL